MKARLFFALGLALALLPCTSSAIEREIDRTFSVQPGCTLRVDSYRGSIMVEESESDQSEIKVKVLLELNTDNDDEADRTRDNLHLEMKQDDNTVSIRARNPRETGVRFVWDDKYQIDLIYRISVPRQCNVDLVTLNGGVTVGNLAGHQKARAETGTLYFKNIDGSIDAATQTGEIIVSRCSGALRARVMRGTIRAGTIGGPADLKNATGDIDVMAATDGIVADTSAGDVSAGFPEGFKGNAKLSADGGNVYARLDPEAACKVDASASWGHVDCKLPLAIGSGGSGKRSLTGQLNAGGPLLTLRASGGHVKITKADGFLP